MLLENPLNNLSENNEKIANFLSWTYHPKNLSLFKFFTSLPSHWKTPAGEMVTHLHFYSDLNLLWEVIDVIESMGYYLHMGKQGMSFRFQHVDVTTFVQHVSSNRDTLYTLVCEFVDWWKEEGEHKPSTYVQKYTTLQKQAVRS